MYLEKKTHLFLFFFPLNTFFCCKDERGLRHPGVRRTPPCILGKLSSFPVCVAFADSAAVGSAALLYRFTWGLLLLQRP